MIYLKLLWSFLQVGMFSFGGGYSTLPLIKQQVVTGNHWLTMKEFTDVITISQMTPGPIALNAATFVGIKVAGFPGALIATFGCVFPTTVIALVIAHYYYKYREMSLVKGIFEGLRPAAIALIGSAGVSILLLALFNTETFSRLPAADLKAVIIFGACLIVMRKFKPNPIFVMLASGAAGVLAYLVIP